MNKLIRNLFFLIAVPISASSLGGVLDINFNGTNFLLGTFESAESGTSFYRYDNPSEASANPVYPGSVALIPLEADALQIFTHINSLNNKLSFGLILEKPNGSGGGTFSTTAAWSTPATLAFVDDPGETGTLGDGGPQNLSLRWIDCCTDGFVISGFNPEDLFIDLTKVVGSDLTKVIFLSPDGQSSNTVFDFPKEQFSISIRPCDPQTDPNQCVIPPPNGVPVPATLLLFGVGLFGLGWLRRLKV